MIKTISLPLASFLCLLSPSLTLQGQSASNQATADFEGPGALLIADFEGESYPEGWQTTGTAFGTGPAQGAIGSQRAVSGYLGKGLANSFLPNDRAVGTLTSPPFKIERNFIRFLIGGGGHRDKTCVNLIVDGKVVRTATGPNTTAGGSEALAEAGWDVSAFKGKMATIAIVDQHTGGWGHINVDHIIQTEKAPKNLVGNANLTTRTDLAIKERYLLLPIGKNKPQTAVSLFANGEQIHTLDIDFSPKDPVRWVPVDLEDYLGQVVTIEAPESVLKSLNTSNDSMRPADLYREPTRPQLHFMPPRGWINDPNGMVYADGRWHLYFQHNPYGNQWGNMAWGHASSADLVRWENHPIAIQGRSKGGTKGMAYSGSAIVDKDNVAGFGKNAILAFLTDTGAGIGKHKRAEVMAYSTDGGLTFTYGPNNPIISHPGRDPKVFWDAPRKQWVMVVYNEENKQRSFHIYTSKDLSSWEKTDSVDGYNLYECPEFFELPIEGGEGKTAWVAIEANGNYLLGDFDGKQFTAFTPEKIRSQYGNGAKSSNAYALQLFNDAPNNRRVGIAWMRLFYPEGMNGSMTIPLEFTLRQTQEGPRLCINPARELQSLRGEPRMAQAMPLTEQEHLVFQNTGDLLDVEATFKVPSGTEAGLRVHGIEIRYDGTTNELTCGDESVKIPDGGAQFKVRVIVDKGIMEIFVNDGIVYCPIMSWRKADRPQTISVFGSGKGEQLESMQVFPMQSIWQ